MAPFPRGFFRTSVLVIFLFTFVTITWLYRDMSVEYGIRSRALAYQQVLRQVKATASDKGRPAVLPLNLEDEECRSSFPSLFADIDSSVARGKFSFSKSDPDYKGLVQGQIKDGKLYILTAASDTLPEILHQRTAILSQIHRALLTSPSPLPDTYFAVCINDVPKNNTWAFARPNKQSKYNTWLMPSFASWSWPKTNLGTMDDVLGRIEAVEMELKWEEKLDKVIWRGTAWFNPIGHPNLRKDLLKATRENEWADVEALSTAGNATNSLKIEDFCRYKYVLYTEGVTYSGRLPFHQACGSVLITAPLTWVTTSALLLRPIDADNLMSSFEDRVKSYRARGSEKSSSTQQAILNPVATWQEANAIYVKPDFSNLESVILLLRSHPEVAQRLAQSQQERFVRQGYLSLAAETCYWRVLIRGWATVAETEDQGWGKEENERYENWLLKEVSRKSEGTRGKIGR
ncbi:Nn.00g077710.m01.CDS01 [Neocucurbitaria sp. VM-36]